MLSEGKSPLHDLLQFMATPEGVQKEVEIKKSTTTTTTTLSIFNMFTADFFHIYCQKLNLSFRSPVGSYQPFKEWINELFLSVQNIYFCLLPFFDLMWIIMTLQVKCLPCTIIRIHPLQG
ncbi:hypothetical protein PPYR_09224 [Photinus pyralis]|uniref:Uncharacterized protein n=1 Tax=Photinus pyralis TaxID=7054 RepID=A0A5N4ALN9_PHOPY|nr:hypothetical protein PPYR_09224 [Photinus pyralis]